MTLFGTFWMKFCAHSIDSRPYRFRHNCEGNYLRVEMDWYVEQLIWCMGFSQYMKTPPWLISLVFPFIVIWSLFTVTGQLILLRGHFRFSPTSCISHHQVVLFMLECWRALSGQLFEVWKKVVLERIGISDRIKKISRKMMNVINLEICMWLLAR